MADKVKLPREVAEALEKILKDEPDLDKDRQFIVWNSAHAPNKFDSGPWGVLYDFVGSGNIFLLADALRYGYEVELEPITVTITPEMQEKITQYYANLDPNTQEDAFDREFVLGERSGVRFTLKMLGITIPGIPSEG